MEGPTSTNACQCLPGAATDASRAIFFARWRNIARTAFFILDAYLPKPPITHRAGTGSYIIRIHSDRKWPERIAYDTSLPTIIPVQIASAEVGANASAMIADVSAKVRVREAFAQLSDTEQLQPFVQKLRKPKLQRQYKVAKRHLPAARQPQFAWFGNGVW